MFCFIMELRASQYYDVTITCTYYILLPEKSPDNSGTIGAAVGGVVATMVVVVALTVMVVLTVYCFMGAKRKDSVDR